MLAGPGIARGDAVRLHCASTTLETAGYLGSEKGGWAQSTLLSAPPTHAHKQIPNAGERDTDYMSWRQDAAGEGGG